MLVHQRATHGKAQAGPVSRRFGSDERVENAVFDFRADASSRIREAHEELVILLACADFELTAPGHRLDRVHGQVGKDLGHPAHIDANPW